MQEVDIDQQSKPILELESQLQVLELQILHLLVWPLLVLRQQIGEVLLVLQ